MMVLGDEQYEELGREVGRLVDGRNGLVCGVVELEVGGFELILGFECLRRRMVRWMVIAFDRGVRCSTDFDVELLRKWIR